MSNPTANRVADKQNRGDSGGEDHPGVMGIMRCQTKMNRRIFLLAGASMTVARAAPADQVMLGVIGSGSRGTFVMGVFQKDASLQVNAAAGKVEAG
jgi:hypothetical protein